MAEPERSQNRYVVVAGGCNRDIGGRSIGPLVSRDSNPGRVTSSLGGVGRNIAHNMALLGLNVHLMTALGQDEFSSVITDSCQSLGINLGHALTVPGGVTSTYLYISGPDGDMSLAISDMSILDQLTPAYFEQHLSFLNGAELVVLDANLPIDSIRWLCNHVTAPLFADPVSAMKAGKLSSVLGKLHTLKPNRLEAQLLSGVCISDAGSLKLAADSLLRSGLRRVFITLGAGGIYAADQEQQLLLPCYPGFLVNTTGCGDSSMAAIAWAQTEGADLGAAAKAALAAGSVTMECSETINPNFSVSALQSRMT